MNPMISMIFRTQEQIAEGERVVRESFMKSMQRELERYPIDKAKARENWIREHTCPHCGKSRELPDWLK